MTKELPKPDMSKVWPMMEYLKFERWRAVDDEDLENCESIEEFSERALSVIKSYHRIKSLEEIFIGDMHPGIIGICLFKIINTMDVEEWVWVVVGDIPTALFSTSAGVNPGQILDVYLGEMAEWCDAVHEGRSVEDLIPVNVEPTKEWADELYSRLEFIGERILMEEYKDDLGYDPDEA